jgi:hypothetical protein
MNVIQSSRAISSLNVESKPTFRRLALSPYLGLMMETQLDDGDRASLRNVVFDSTLTRLIAREDLITD